MIDREKSEMARLLREVKKGIRAEVRRGADTNSESNEKSRDEEEDCTTYHGRIPLVLGCPGTVTTLALCQSIENDVRSQSQLQLRQFFKLRAPCSPLSVGVVPQRRFPIRSCYTTL